MTDENTGTVTEENAPANPATPDPTPPPAPPANNPPPANSNSGGGNSSGTDLLSAINSLPEKIVNAIKEGTQPPTAPAPATSGAAGQEGGGAAAQASGGAAGQAGGKKTFAQWWFGSK